MKRKLFEEYQEFKKENPDNEELDLKEYPRLKLRLDQKIKILRVWIPFFCIITCKILK